MDRLCALSGQGAAALVRQIGIDLAMLAALVEHSPDAPTLRRALHDTRALAGTCGAGAAMAAADALRDSLMGCAVSAAADRAALAAILRALADRVTALWPR
ncbi:MAG TPA: hypothetical protein PKD10_08850 [Paracoccaceae bacterium]|nr:hypothetical protein [Paracoccaceae bacterium]HMO72480.1 hypothetical protein [Paracoccaceae bacterium]